MFVFHSLASNENVLVSYEADADSGRADPDSREVLLTVDKEPDKIRHNGGRLVFGPDGYLYASLGDAARASVNGQDPSTLPGSILRIDVDIGDPYAIPSDNPFADGDDGAPEVWWFGLRNPWGFSIDEASGLAYIADVGQETSEEVNVVPYDDGGLNFGWPSLEGAEAFYSDEPAGEVTEPVLVVRHNDEDQGCSITGGRVYRGAAIPELDGHYFYADWCHGWVRSFRQVGERRSMSRIGARVSRRRWSPGSESTEKVSCSPWTRRRAASPASSPFADASGIRLSPGNLPSAPIAVTRPSTSANSHSPSSNEAYGHLP